MLKLSTPGAEIRRKVRENMRVKKNSPQKGEIVVYQPNNTMRLEARLQDENIWLPQQKIADLFGVKKSAISKHLKNIFSSGELKEVSTVSKMATVQIEGGREVTRLIEIYNLDAIIAVGYRVNSLKATQFRIWATQVLKTYLLKGYAFNSRLDQIEDRLDRKFASHDSRLVNLEEKVGYFVKTALPPKEKVLSEGRMLDAQFELTRIIKTARKRIVLVDNYIDERTLMLLGNRRAKVECIVYTMKPNSPKLAPALANYKRQYPAHPITLKGYKKSHDRFLIIDNTIWHIGASLKDAGAALFALMRMELDASIILSMLK